MTEAEAIRAFGENCKWLRRRIQELEEQLGIRQEEQRRMDQEDEEVFQLVHGPRPLFSCLSIAEAVGVMSVSG